MLSSKIKSKLVNFEVLCSKALQLIFSGFIGFLMSKTNIFNVISPFSVSYLSVTPFLRLSPISSFVGIVFGYLTSSITASNLKYICINTLLVLLITISGNKNYRNNVYSCILPGVLLFSGSFVYFIFDIKSIVNALFYLLESVLSVCLSYFIKYSGESLQRNIRLDLRDIISINILINIILLSLKEYDLFGISTSLLFLLIIIYLTIYYIPVKYSLLFIAPLCICYGIFNITYGVKALTVFMPSIAAIFASKIDDKYIVPSYFIVFSTMISLNGFGYYTIKEMLAPVFAGIVFYMIPKRNLSPIISRYVSVKKSKNASDLDNEEICSKFNDASLTLANNIGSAVISPIITDKIKLKITKKLSLLKYKNIEILNFYNRSGKQLVNVSFSSNKVDSLQVQDFLEQATGYSFKISECVSEGKNHTIKFEQHDNYIVDCFALYKSKQSENLCGDTICAFKTSNSLYNVMLADGMGSGEEAYLKSKNAIELMKKLICSNVSPCRSIETVNSTMYLMTSGLGFSTMDLVTISLKTGMADFYKCGAYLTLLFRNNTVTKILGGGYPLGLQGENKPVYENIQLLDNDILVMLSDGASNASEQVEAKLLLSNNSNIENLARDIISIICRNTPIKYDDDTSVVVCKISEKQV